MKVTRKSMFIRTPDIEKVSNYYLVQLLIQERIRSVLLGQPFRDLSRELAAKYLTIPPHYQTADAINKYVESEAKAIHAAFKKYEDTPVYKEQIALLRQYEGSIFSIVSTTMQGIMVLIEVEK